MATQPDLPFLNSPRDIDPSYKMDLDFWDCFGRKYGRKNLDVCSKDSVLEVPKAKIVEFVISVEPDELVHSEPPHLDLFCLPCNL